MILEGTARTGGRQMAAKLKAIAENAIFDHVPLRGRISLIPVDAAHGVRHGDRFSIGRFGSRWVNVLAGSAPPCFELLQEIPGSTQTRRAASLVFLLSVHHLQSVPLERTRGCVGKRIYIYRSGATDKCALTGIKDDPRLPPASVPDGWRFWMQIGPVQAQGGRCGFDVAAAVNGIRTKGYYLFLGSRALLHERPSARPKQGRSWSV
jgi:hypothetical protein